MGERLTALVQGSNDLPLIDYVLEELGKGVAKATCSASKYIGNPRKAALQRKFELLWAPRIEVSIYVQRQRLLELQRQRTALLRERVTAVRELTRGQTAVLHKQLRDPDPALRLTAVQAVAVARPHLEGELIPLLDDADVTVRRAAREALVRLARGADFGPAPRAGKAERLQAQGRWRDWWVLQEACPSAERLKLAAAARPASPHSAEARRLARDLAEAAPARQAVLLAKLRDGDGEAHTEALGAAIPQLGAALQGKARDALAERLRGAKADAVRAALKSPDGEVRRAAALACAAKKDKALLPDLLPLLEDDEPPAAAAAAGALKALAGKDFGPRAGADAEERALAAAAWRAWWSSEGKRK